MRRAFSPRNRASPLHHSPLNRLSVERHGVSNCEKHGSDNRHNRGRKKPYRGDRRRPLRRHRSRILPFPERHPAPASTVPPHAASSSHTEMPKTEMIAIRPIDRDRQAKKLSREEKCRAELSTVPGTPPATPWTSSARDRRNVISLSNFPDASATLTELLHHGSKTNRTRPPRIVSPHDLNIPAVLVMIIQATTHSSTMSCGGHRPSISCGTRTPTRKRADPTILEYVRKERRLRANSNRPDKGFTVSAEPSAVFECQVTAAPALLRSIATRRYPSTHIAQFGIPPRHARKIRIRNPAIRPNPANSTFGHLPDFDQPFAHRERHGAACLRPIEGDAAGTIGRRVKQIVVVGIGRSYGVVLRIMR